MKNSCRVSRAQILILLVLCFPLCSAPTSTASVLFDFEFPDGTIDLGQGTILVGNANFMPSVQTGRLQLTNSTAGNNSAFHLPAIPGSSNGIEVWFDYEIIDRADGQITADGFSFSYGAIPFGTNSFQPEEGWPGVANVVSYEMDTFDFNLGNPPVERGPAIGLNRPMNVNDIGGSTHASSLANTVGDLLTEGQTISGTVHILMTSDGITDFQTTGAITDANFVSINAGASGFLPSDDYTFAIAARTGGLVQDIFIDNLRIETIVPEPSALALVLLGQFLLTQRRMHY